MVVCYPQIRRSPTNETRSRQFSFIISFQILYWRHSDVTVAPLEETDLQ